jgi:uncharacterized protein GlcG (DUF336 family)
MRRFLFVLAGFMVAGMSSVQAADDPMMVATKRMTLPVATKVAQGAIDECTRRGIQIGVTVVDREGIVQVTMRDTIAAPITALISKDKAYTAANFNAATSSLTRIKDSPIGRFPGLVPEAGGVPIEVGGSLIGGVGVSGAPDGKVDEECAQAGVDAVLDDLEMSSF